MSDVAADALERIEELRRRMEEEGEPVADAAAAGSLGGELVFEQRMRLVECPGSAWYAVPADEDWMHDALADKASVAGTLYASDEPFPSGPPPSRAISKPTGTDGGRGWPPGARKWARAMRDGGRAWRISPRSSPVRRMHEGFRIPARSRAGRHEAFGERRLIRREPVSRETKGANDVHRSRIRERHAVRRGARRQPHGGARAQPRRMRSDGVDEVIRALENPIGTPRLRDIVRPGERIAVVTSDITRPFPTYAVMPALLDELYAAGVDPADVTLVFALGSHRFHTEEERRHLAGERAWREIRCIDGDPSSCVHVGKTKAGTPVDIVDVVADADRRICLGNSSTTTSPGTRAGRRPSCRACPRARPSRPTTRRWSIRAPVPETWTTIRCARTSRRRRPWWTATFC